MLFKEAAPLSTPRGQARPAVIRLRAKHMTKDGSRGTTLSVLRAGGVTSGRLNLGKMYPPQAWDVRIRNLIESRARDDSAHAEPTIYFIWCGHDPRKCRSEPRLSD